MSLTDSAPTRGELMVRAISLSSQVIDSKNTWNQLKNKIRPKETSKKEWCEMHERVSLHVKMTKAAWLQAEWELRKAYPNHPAL